MFFIQSFQNLLLGKELTLFGKELTLYQTIPSLTLSQTSPGFCCTGLLKTLWEIILKNCRLQTLSVSKSLKSVIWERVK